LENELLRVEFDHETGIITSITNKVSGKKVELTQTWEWYKASVGTPEDGQASGAYIFRPNSSSTTSFSGKAEIRVIKGETVNEVWQTYSDIVSQKYRLYKDQPVLELEYTLGPLDVNDGVGKEAILKFSTDIDSKDTFYTDANGREILKRVRNYRPCWQVDLAEPVAGNYYPINTRAFLRDDEKDVQFTIITDRSQGGSSLTSGELEIMVNRRLTHDDGRGVGEPLNEDIVVRGRYWISVGKIEDEASFHRVAAEQMQHPTATIFTPSPITKPIAPLLLEALPPNVQLVTLLKLHGDENYGILRLGHLFAKGEDSKLSLPATVDVKKAFGFDIKEELSLSANQKLSEMAKFSLDGRETLEPSIVKDSTVVLNPMEIRTYLVQFTS